VLAWEGAARARVTLTLLGPAAMRRLNRRTFGRRALTDVISFPLPQPDGRLVGDVYLCPAAAAAWVRTAHREGAEGRVVTLREELLRLAVHGTLHILGYDHSAGPGRTRSIMWKKQERYLQRLTGTGR
jgi:probable rRNA maturation factor